MPPPTPNRLLRKLGLESRDQRLLLLMGALVAVLLCAYTIAKVLRDALFLSEYGALALPYAYVGVALAAVFFVWLETRVARRVSRRHATRFTQIVAIAFSVAAAIVFPVWRHGTALVFYLWTGSQAMMLLPHFWVIALDAWDTRRARRVFPLLSGCGLLGGALGGGIAGWLTPVIQRSGLLWTLSALLVLAYFLTRAAEAQAAHHKPAPASQPTGSPWKIVLGSRYIQLLAVGLALSVAVGTLVDFQFKYFIQRLYPEPHALTQFLGLFYLGLNALALVFQFGIAGWLLQRMGLAASTGLQPTSVLLFASWLTFSVGPWAVIAMRWVQGVVFQTLGKSSSEIYYSAIHPRERRFVKPAIDTLVDRWADALVGVMLIVVLRFLRVPMQKIAFATAVLAGLWLLVLLFLNRSYARAFREALSARWLERDLVPEMRQLPETRHAVAQALRGDDEPRVLAALEWCAEAPDRRFRRAVYEKLRHPSPAVRAAAVTALEALRAPDPEGRIEAFLGDTHEGLRRAAISYLVGRSSQADTIVRRLFEGQDAVLRTYALTVLQDHPRLAQRLLTPEWIDQRLRAADPAQRLEAALALGSVDRGLAVPRLRTLLADPDLDVRRAALRAAGRRSSHELIDVLLPALFTPETSPEAHVALAAVGDGALAALEPYLDGTRGLREQSLAAHVVADIGTPRARRRLLALANSADKRLRHLGLTRLARMRLRSGSEMVSRGLAHRFFVREMREYRQWNEPAQALTGSAEPEIRLLQRSLLESADMALARGLQGLACWYDPPPLIGAFERLRSRDSAAVGLALEFLAHVLPRKLFQWMEEMFDDLPDADVRPMPPSRDEVTQAIRLAWKDGDTWLRACAVRASRAAPWIDPAREFTGGSEDHLVRAELDALKAAS
ncbi:MAG TPA: HEAT repeat domain-containing protein [Candidatus Eisenbacteria bacterium]|jgi:ATP/ADP translocase|nr:HEAT repeat domain-containing protein [Candidatus Eisenbacteria bacterium]